MGHRQQLRQCGGSGGAQGGGWTSSCCPGAAPLNIRRRSCCSPPEDPGGELSWSSWQLSSYNPPTPPPSSLLVYCNIDFFKHLCSVARQNSGWVFLDGCNIQLLIHFGFLMTNQHHTAVPIQPKSYALGRSVFCNIYNIDFSRLYPNPNL